MIYMAKKKNKKSEKKKQEAVVSKKVVDNSQDKDYKNLRKYNLIMGFIHFVQGVLILVLSTNFVLPLMTNYLQFDPVLQILVPVQKTIAEIPIAPLVAVFLFFSALAHFLLTIPMIYKKYIINLKKGINYLRWYEYAFSSSLMMIVIAMLVGVYDLSTLLAIFFVNMAMILFGLMMELHNQRTEKTDWTSYIYGCIMGIVPWVIIALYLFNSGDGENKAPTFVYWIFFSIFLFFNSFALNMFLQYKKIGPWKNYVFGEKMYILLSLVAKSLLAWQVFAGTLRPV